LHAGLTVPWLKLLHVGAVIVWCGALLYLLSMLAATTPVAAAGRTVPQHWPRSIFIGVATPAALLAIVAGTWIFASQGPLAPWLMLKLSIVGLLVLGHGACGVLVLRAERGQFAGVRVACHVLTLSTVLWLLAITWLVLRKPA